MLRSERAVRVLSRLYLTRALNRDTRAGETLTAPRASVTLVEDAHVVSAWLVHAARPTVVDAAGSWRRASSSAAATPVSSSSASAPRCAVRRDAPTPSSGRLQLRRDMVANASRGSRRAGAPRRMRLQSERTTRSISTRSSGQAKLSTLKAQNNTSRTLRQTHTFHSALTFNWRSLRVAPSTRSARRHQPGTRALRRRTVKTKHTATRITHSLPLHAYRLHRNTQRLPLSSSASFPRVAVSLTFD